MLATAFAVSCSSEGEPEPGSGGAPGSSGSGTSGTGGAGTSSTAGSGGSAAGSGGSGTGGALSGAGGSAAGTAGTGNPAGGAPGGSGGSTAGSGGSAAGTGGSASGAGGLAGDGGTGTGATGGAGGSAGGTAGASGSGSAGSGGGKSSAGCGKAAPANQRYTIDVDGMEREYILKVPDNYDPETPYRLIFGWHPLGGSAQQVASGNYYNLVSPSQGSAIFVAPEGLPFSGSNLGWGNNNGRDLAFLDAMMERFRAELCIDEDRIFSTGFSFGGMMSFAVGCQEGGVMRAIAPQAGNIQVSGCENGDRAVAVMGFHGDDDTVVAIDGGRAGRDKFIERNGCTTQTMPLSPSWCDGLGQSNQPCSCVSYQGCDEGYPVIWCEFNGPHTPAPSSGQTIWDFFAQF